MHAKYQLGSVLRLRLCHTNQRLYAYKTPSHFDPLLALISSLSVHIVQETMRLEKTQRFWTGQSQVSGGAPTVIGLGWDRSSLQFEVPIDLWRISPAS